MLRSLNPTQQEMLIFSIQDTLNHLISKKDYVEKERLVNSLANDESALIKLEEIFRKVCKRYEIEQGESNMWNPVNSGAPDQAWMHHNH
mmetsp:Transcript_6438/g.10928  ORF Transcript_6438/g.10928 Transcript_6438/m.10928 type:complete len:89 (-) Transcript_6438:25-291(-)